MKLQTTLLIFTVLLLPYIGHGQQELRQLSSENAQQNKRFLKLTDFLEDSGSSSLVLLQNGEVLYDWGDTSKKILVHSIRKALLNSLYGIYIANGTIDTTKTLNDLGIEDIEPVLTEEEKSATIADLLRSRSGIYHPAAAVAKEMLRSMPKRGSHRPGETFYYNNWDFNTLGFILEQETGRKLYDVFYSEIAQPLGMNYANNYTSVTDPSEDWLIPDVDGFYQYESDRSKYPAYHFRLSAEDLARYGQLYLNKGTWEGQRILPENWIEVSTRPYSVYDPRHGIAYGMLWNVLMETEDRPNKAFFHTGTSVHLLGIYPARNLVLVHRVNTEKEYSFGGKEFSEMIRLVFEAVDQKESVP